MADVATLHILKKKKKDISLWKECGDWHKVNPKGNLNIFLYWLHSQGEHTDSHHTGLGCRPPCKAQILNGEPGGSPRRSLMVGIIPL